MFDDVFLDYKTHFLAKFLMLSDDSLKFCMEDQNHKRPKNKGTTKIYKI